MYHYKPNTLHIIKNYKHNLNNSIILYMYIIDLTMTHMFNFQQFTFYTYILYTQIC